MSDILGELQGHREVDRVTYFHIEFVGPSRVYMVAAVDMLGDDAEPDLARRLRALEHSIEQSDRVQDCVLTLSTPEEETITPESFFKGRRGRAEGVIPR